MRFAKILLLVTGAVIGAGCSEPSGNAVAEQEEDQATTSFIGVVAPEYERSFEEKYKVKLNLPMDEDDFIALIEGLGLRYRGKGPDSATIKNREVGLRPDPPQHTQNYDMSNISHSYYIGTGFNRIKCRNENYLALVRNDRKVVYVENQFVYAKISVPFIC